MWKIALIGACGGAGAILRHLVSVWSLHWFGSGFPVGTLIVNVVGCFLLGTLYELTETTLLISGEWRHALGVGFLGGLTTFSTFGYETHTHLQSSLWRHAAVNVVLNVALGLLAVWAGISIAKFAAAQP
ncbi:MAG TPA: fluoride efflux transporter CrcB [Pirellulaceae bacterium]|nr:fluoride efflux transporter CrcB [Planctomycetales bacterium]MCB9939682.1 fluoride efflux transporter CrcB [Planctomycetaceae bacterium]HRX79587.1 fluoride efflux transporter CrcB [Pirellulaceae bacterium]